MVLAVLRVAEGAVALVAMVSVLEGMGVSGPAITAGVWVARVVVYAVATYVVSDRDCGWLVGGSESGCVAGSECCSVVVAAVALLGEGSQ
jgi:hypothetical protein